MKAMSRKTKCTAQTEEAVRTLVPKMRFPEFRGEGAWTTETLASMVRISTEKVGDKTCIPMSITSGVGLVSPSVKAFVSLTGTAR